MRHTRHDMTQTLRSIGNTGYSSRGFETCIETRKGNVETDIQECVVGVLILSITCCLAASIHSLNKNALTVSNADLLQIIVFED